MTESEIMQEEDNILQAAQQHQDRLLQEERLCQILILLHYEASFRPNVRFSVEDVDFIATMCGKSDYRN